MTNYCANACCCREYVPTLRTRHYDPCCSAICAMEHKLANDDHAVALQLLPPPKANKVVQLFSRITGRGER